MKLNKWLFIDVIFLMLFGLLMIYSSSSIWAEYKFGNSWHYVLYQGVFIVISIILIIILSKIDYHIYYKLSAKLLIISIILLILVLIPGIGIIRNGSRSWFGIGGLGIQPSEFSKLALIIFTSKYLEKSNKFIKDYKKGVLPILFILLIVFGLIMLEPDFGTGMIIVVSIIALLFIAGVNMKFFIILGVIGIAGIIGLITCWYPWRNLRPWASICSSGSRICRSGLRRLSVWWPLRR